MQAVISRFGSGFAGRSLCITLLNVQYGSRDSDLKVQATSKVT